MSLLTAFLGKRGIKSPDELDGEEKKTYENWARILSGGDAITVEKIKEFCQIQIGTIEAKWRNNQGEANAQLIPYHTCYKLILDAINAPNAQREALEKQLTQLINAPTH